MYIVPPHPAVPPASTRIPAPPQFSILNLCLSLPRGGYLCPGHSEFCILNPPRPKTSFHTAPHKYIRIYLYTQDSTLNQNEKGSSKSSKSNPPPSAFRRPSSVVYPLSAFAPLLLPVPPPGALGAWGCPSSSVSNVLLCVLCALCGNKIRDSPSSLPTSALCSCALVLLCPSP